MFKGTPGERFYPANNTEASAFDRAHCALCERDATYRTTQRGGCSIIVRALAEMSVPEWTYGPDGRPVCSGFWKAGTPMPQIVHPDAAQRSLFDEPS